MNLCIENNITNKKTCVIFVDDESNVLSGLRRMLRSNRREWDMHFAHGAQEALTLVSDLETSVIVSDMKMPDIDGATVLNEISRTKPEVVRLILSGQAEKSKILEVAGVAHQFLSKPCDSDVLRSTICKIFDSQQQLNNPKLKSLVTQISSVPALDENFSELGNAFDSGESAFGKIKSIVSRDIGLSAKVMQMVSTSFFGTPQPKISVLAACDLLGFDLLNQLFFDKGVFQPLECETLGKISFSDLYKHSYRVAQLAAEIARLNTCSEETIAVTGNAGLFHDIGRLILARYFPEEYSQALQLVEQQDIELDVAEQQVFGSPHTDVGSFLLNLWGISTETVTTVRSFKEPDDPPTHEFNSSTAVFAANQLVNEQFGRPPKIPLEESERIREVGCVDAVATWRSLVSS